MEQPLDSTFPSIVFEAGGTLFSVDSQYIATIVRVPDFEQIPDAPPTIKGIFQYRDAAITMLDLRAALTMRSQEEEYQDFIQMIEDRKQDHIHWVDELERTSLAGEHFPLATDPHQCTLGRWCDHFHSEVSEINFHMKKIFPPHEALHQQALKTIRIGGDRDSPTRQHAILEIISTARREYMPKVLSLLDASVEIFRSSFFNDMGLVLRGNSNMCLVVDKVLSVEHLTSFGSQAAMNEVQHTPYITHVQKSEKIPGLIMCLDIPQLFQSVGVDLTDHSS